MRFVKSNQYASVHVKHQHNTTKQKCNSQKSLFDIDLVIKRNCTQNMQQKLEKTGEKKSEKRSMNSDKWNSREMFSFNAPRIQISELNGNQMENDVHTQIHIK